MTPHQKRVERTRKWLLRRFGVWPRVTEIAEWHLRMGGRAPGEGARKNVRPSCETCNGWDVCMYSFKPCRYWRPKRGCR